MNLAISIVIVILVIIGISCYCNPLPTIECNHNYKSKMIIYYHLDNKPEKKNTIVLFECQNCGKRKYECISYIPYRLENILKKWINKELSIDNLSDIINRR